MARGPPIIWGVELGGSWMDFYCGVPAFSANVFPGEGGRFSCLTLAFLPIDEKNPPVDLLADSGNAIGRDLIENGGDVTVRF